MPYGLLKGLGQSIAFSLRNDNYNRTPRRVPRTPCQGITKSRPILSGNIPSIP